MIKIVNKKKSKSKKILKNIFQHKFKTFFDDIIHERTLTVGVYTTERNLFCSRSDQMLQEEEINLKINSLKIDMDCMTVRESLKFKEF